MALFPKGRVWEKEVKARATSPKAPRSMTKVAKPSLDFSNSLVLTETAHVKRKERCIWDPRSEYS